jgi:predicted NAD/FAD-binding protein
MLRSILRFNSEAEHHLDNLEEFVTLGDYLSLYNYPEEFINDFIIPMGAAIWSTKPVNMMKMPAIFFIQFFRNHGLLAVKNRPNWWVIKGGSKCYVEKMTISFNDKIRIATPVKKVKRNERSIEVIYGKTAQESETFDAVIFATHSDQALSLLEKPSVQEVKILEALQYQKNEALLHLDESILPKRKLAWASWNYLLDQNPEEPVALTYNMNILQSLNSDHTFCVTLNNHDAIDPSKVIKKIIYHHPLYTVDAIKAQSRKHEINGQKNTYYCGAYCHNGFHDDGVVSALDVCEHFGEKL